MPTYEHGDLWSAFRGTDLFCFTTNSILRRDGRLVMGAGVARQARDRIPGLDLRLGARIRELGAASAVYGLIVLEPEPCASSERRPLLGALQTKVQFRDPSPLDLVALSVRELAGWMHSHPGSRVDLPFPGIGLGGLDPTDVQPILDPLPPIAHVWRFQPT